MPPARRAHTSERKVAGLASLLLPEIHVDKADLCSIADQFNGTVKTQFVHYAGPVVLNRLGADD